MSIVATKIQYRPEELVTRLNNVFSLFDQLVRGNPSDSDKQQFLNGLWQALEVNDNPDSVADILAEIRQHYHDVPADAETHVQEFIDQLMSKGLAGYEFQG